MFWLNSNHQRYKEFLHMLRWVGECLKIDKPIVLNGIIKVYEIGKLEFEILW